MFHKWVCSFRECRTNCQGSEVTTYEVYEGDNVLHGWRGSCWLGMEPVISSQEKLGRVQSGAFSVQPHLPAPGAGLVARSRHGRRYPCRLGSLRSTVGGQNRAKMGKIRLKMGRSVKIRVKWGNWRKNVILPPMDLRWLLLQTEMWSDTRGWFSTGIQGGTFQILNSIIIWKNESDAPHLYLQMSFISCLTWSEKFII